MPRLLMVCMGNICRSPIAEAVTRALVERAGLAGMFEIESAGTHDYHVGEPPDKRALRVAARHGYDLSGLRARQVEDEDFGYFDFLLAMDRHNLAHLQRRCPPQYHAKLGLFLAFGGTDGPDEVPDPYYGGIDGFERTVKLCEAGARRVVLNFVPPERLDKGIRSAFGKPR